MNQKLENLLQLALQTPEEIREETEDLNVGFDSLSRTWELIVKYHGSLDVLAGIGVGVEYLIAGYAILTVPEAFVDQMLELEQIEYVEKPKRYFYQQIPPTEGSCLEPVIFRDPNLTGKGVLLAVIDSGIDYKLSEFRDEEGNTRIRYLWDQTLRPEEEHRPPEGFSVGVEFTAEEINAALAAEGSEQQFSLLPTVDTGGHGTAVAGIAAGSSTRYRGVAVEAELLIVKLGVADSLGFPRTTEIMRAVTYAVNKAVELQMPLVINLSFGNTYGAHDGSSLLERFLDNAAEIGRTVICVGSGNEGANGGHVAGSIIPSGGAGGSLAGGAGGNVTGGAGRAGNGFASRTGRTIGSSGYLPAEIELAVAQYERSLNVQLWKNYSDVYRIYLRSPGGQEAELPSRIEGGKYTLRLEQTDILVYLGEPLPYSTAQEIYLDLFPVGGPYINSGVWTIRLVPVEVVTGNYYLYLPSSAVRSQGTGFYRPTPEVTLTIPSTASKVVTVGAYDGIYDAYADFSGRGYADTERTIGVVMSGLAKPDLAAPGVNILAPDLYGGYHPVTGTSFATPIVSGSGIVRGHDVFLYGEKVNAYLRKGARPLRGEGEVPNDRVGWGALCVRDSLPE